MGACVRAGGEGVARSTECSNEALTVLAQPSCAFQARVGGHLSPIILRSITCRWQSGHARRNPRASGETCTVAQYSKLSKATEGPSQCDLWGDTVPLDPLPDRH